MRWFLVLCGLTAVGCVEAADEANEEDGSPFARVDAQIEVSVEGTQDATVADFGEVRVGDSRDLVVAVRNVGTDTLAIHDVVLSDTEVFQLIDVASLAPLVTPEQSTEVRLRYSPASDQSSEAALTLASNDRDTPEVTVPIVAEGLGPRLVLRPEQHDFGTVEIGTVVGTTVWVDNLGRADLVANNVWFEDLSADGEMHLTAAFPEGLIISPGSSEPIAVEYEPRDTSADEGVLHIESNDPDAADAVVRFFGAGRLP